jgi:hypothetical protein
MNDSCKSSIPRKTGKATERLRKQTQQNPYLMNEAFQQKDVMQQNINKLFTFSYDYLQ